MAAAPRFDADAVRRYYDRSTGRFLALGQGGGEGAIHRAVWGPGVRDRRDAFHYVHDRLAALVPPPAADGEPPHVLDLGCGVGGSLLALAARVPIRGTGVTISSVQARLGAARLAAMGVDDRLACLEGDYTALPHDLPPVALAYAIESFVHGPDPAAFFREAARVLAPAGHLAICDDVLRECPGAGRRTVDRFRRGWHVNTLVTRDEMTGLAAAAGLRLVTADDLTPWLELGRPRDRLLASIAPVLWHVPGAAAHFGGVLGGVALQTCLARGWIAYELLVFQRAP